MTNDNSMDDKRFRFSEKEKTVLFELFKQYQDVIDIRHRRYSQSQHKQTTLRNCWNKILDDFNQHPDTVTRSMKQIQKFWLNSKLRNRLPNEEVKLKLENESNDKSNNRGDAAYRELAKHCKEEDDIELDDQHEMMDAEDSTETHQEIEVVNVPESYDGQYENINESYFQNTGESITLKVIDNQLNYSLPTPTAASLVAIPQTSHLNATIVAAPSSADSKKRQFDGASSTGPFIAYTPLRQDRVISDNQIARTHYLLATTTSSESTSVASAPPAQAPPAQATRKETVVVSTEQSATIQNLQRREHELRLKEAKIRVEIQEIEREKAREELIQMREIHKLKIKEMELKLRNMERS